MTDSKAIKNNPFNEIGKKPSMKYSGEYSLKNFHVEMRDGVKIAVTLCLPKNLGPSDKIPALLTQTRYLRAMELRIPFRWIFDEIVSTTPNPEIITGRGYAFIITDVRGTGASYGIRKYPFSDAEVKDGYDIVEWIISQPWSDGNVVSKGISYTGTTAELFAVNNHPAIKAIIPGHGFWDPYTDVAFPGGAYDHAFMELWSFLGKNLDLNNPKAFREMMPELWLYIRGVKPVDSDKKFELLNEAVELHKSNEYVFEHTLNKSFRDERLPDDTNIDDLSIFKRKSLIEKSNIPILAWCSYYDSGYCDAIIHRFINYSNPLICILGDWNHGAWLPANQFHLNRTKVSPSPTERINTWINFFDQCIYGDGIQGKILYYYTIVEEAWKKTTIWPPKGCNYQKLYFSDNLTLSKELPNEENSKDDYKINYRSSSGRFNRWWALLGLPIIYDNRAREDERLLTYCSSPFKEDTEITGHIIACLYISSTHDDGALFVYIEDVDEEGKITYITDGEFRVIHRKISSNLPPYKTLIPYHSFLEKDATPLNPGEIAEIKFGLHVTSVLLKKGHRLKIAIAGCDKDTFSRYPSEGRPTINVYHSKSYASYIDIPIIQNDNRGDN
ncbi:MAG: CocE/NonD family hydrolase [Candidatus Lokiarchaeota archaeon]|nr:CocE/NonD family hydrolase [Candidatus Lokiarchaeota archaeon]